VIDKLVVTVSEYLDPATVNALNRMVWSYGGHFYVITEGSLTWADAEAYAQSLGGHLVTINGQAEQDWLYPTFGRLGNLWTGLTDKDAEGSWAWASGQAVAYTSWATGEPSTSTSYNYAYVNGSNGKWYDESNTATHYGIIELEGPDADGDLVPDVLDPYPADPLNAWDLREAGADGIFDTADDVIYRLTLDPVYSSGKTVGLFIQGGPLGNGHYRFTANSTVTDRTGNALDGNADGAGGDAYQRVFDVALPSGRLFEGPNNDTLATATQVSLSEDPAGSGYFAEYGIGSLQPTSDADYWRFEALAGDLVSISVDVPGSSLRPLLTSSTRRAALSLPTPTLTAAITGPVTAPSSAAMPSPAAAPITSG